MNNVLGIKFREYGQIYYFDEGDASATVGDFALVSTEQGQGYGEIVAIRDTVPQGEEVPDELIKIDRVATDEDKIAAAENTALEQDAMQYCNACVAEHKLEMHLVDVETFFDRSKIIFYFTAPTRIDFRELVKDLVKNYRTRIELRQIGVRHETQMIGAVGNCGMTCCCRRFLRKFAPVTIKMAKEQNLFLNPAKISGICGRLLCCLSYEQENYDDFQRSCPKLGKKYQTADGSMKVLRANMFRNSVTLLQENNEELEISLDDWAQMQPARHENEAANNAAGGTNGAANGSNNTKAQSTRDADTKAQKVQRAEQNAKAFSSVLMVQSDENGETVIHEDALSPDEMAMGRTTPNAHKIAAPSQAVSEAKKVQILAPNAEAKEAGAQVNATAPHSASNTDVASAPEMPKPLDADDTPQDGSIFGLRPQNAPKAAIPAADRRNAIRNKAEEANNAAHTANTAPVSPNATSSKENSGDKESNAKRTGTGQNLPLAIPGAILQAPIKNSSSFLRKTSRGKRRRKRHTDGEMTENNQGDM